MDSLIPILNFGRQPHANSFLTPEEYKDEYFYEMIIGYDPITNAIGLVNTNKREELFNDHYAFFSKTSKRMIEHFDQTADKLRVFVKDGIVVEIGCNDGIMLDAWQKRNIPHLGIDPSTNATQVAKDNGHEVIDDFLSPRIAEKILETNKVDLVYGANVSCHVVNLDEYFESIAKLIGKTGVFVFEDPYFLDIYKKCSYDQFYGEHAWIFTVRFLDYMFSKYNLKIFNCEHLWVHGGSMRYYICHEDLYPVNEVVHFWASQETDLQAKLIELGNKINKSKRELPNILEAVKGKNICGFGATSKGVVVCNFCGIGQDLIPFITDTTPTKIGKTYPGVHIPIKSQFETDYSKIDYMVCFAWNHFEEIKSLNLGFKGKWITHVPYPHIE